ncbi:MAG TPA: hypothetical protein HA367_05605 [Candidatus Methanofastidiosum sp.]|nr:hypothetical protein [Methanofastidiosum sp.]
MKIDIDVPDGVSGNWKVETFAVQDQELSQVISMFKTGRGVPGGTYKALKRGRTVVMSNTPDEISDFMSFVYRAKGSVLVNGLGLGVLLKALLNKPEVTDITVIELSEDVIKLVAPTYQTDNRVTIIHGDAFTYKPPIDKKYDAVWHDIWDYICGDNLEEMKKLHRKYGKRSKYQESWCRDRCELANRQGRYY